MTRVILLRICGNVLSFCGILSVGGALAGVGHILVEALTPEVEYTINKRHAEVCFQTGIYYQGADTCLVHGTDAVDEQRKLPAELHGKADKAEIQHVDERLFGGFAHQQNY